MPTPANTARILPAEAPGAPPCPPWWRFPMVWFALAGPALVVVAGFVTMSIAFSHADVVLAEPQAHDSGRGSERAGATAPALQARNHAATPASREPR